MKFKTLLAALAITATGNAQLLMNTNFTPQQMVQNFFQGNGITISNISYTGYSNAIAIFSDTSNAGCGLNLTNGIFLTSGSVLMNDPANPWSSGMDGPLGPASNFQSLDQAQCGATGIGDADLSGLTLATTYDAAAIEFDFIPTYDTLVFNYVFGSEEYNEYVNAGFNDVFAIFLEGLTTPLTKTNIALLPNSSTIVSINNVNNGSSGTVGIGPCTNCAYYRDNYNGNSGINLTYDGLTTVLQVRYPVVPNAGYHLKIAIADVGDHILDSGMFLESGSFSSIGVATGVSPAAAEDELIQAPAALLLNGSNAFQVKGGQLSSYRLLVYDNMGRTVYSTRSMNDAFTGESLSNGVYYYSISAEDIAGREHSKRGIINLLK